MALQLEERDLVAEHGTAYEAYRERVPMLVPGLKAKGARAGRAPATGQPRTS